MSSCTSKSENKFFVLSLDQATRLAGAKFSKHASMRMSGVERDMPLNKVIQVKSSIAYTSGVCFYNYNSHLDVDEQCLEDVEKESNLSAVLIICRTEDLFKNKAPLVLVVSSDFSCIITLYFYDPAKCSESIRCHVPRNGSEWQLYAEKNKLQWRNPADLIKHYHYRNGYRREVRAKDSQAYGVYSELVEQEKLEEAKANKKKHKSLVGEVADEIADSHGNTLSGNLQATTDADWAMWLEGNESPKSLYSDTSSDAAPEDWSYTDGVTLPVVREIRSVSVDDASFFCGPEERSPSPDVFDGSDDDDSLLPLSKPLTAEQELERGAKNAAKSAVKALLKKTITGEPLIADEQAQLDERKRNSVPLLAPVSPVLECRNVFSLLYCADDNNEIVSVASSV